jgi:hypothetical protein
MRRNTTVSISAVVQHFLEDLPRAPLPKIIRTLEKAPDANQG